MPWLVEPPFERPAPSWWAESLAKVYTPKTSKYWEAWDIMPIRILEPKDGYQSADAGWVGTVCYSHGTAMLCKATCSRVTGMDVVWWVSVANDNDHHLTRKNSHNGFCIRVRQEPMVVLYKGGIKQTIDWANEPPWYVDAVVSTCQMRYPDCIIPGQVVDDPRHVPDWAGGEARRKAAWNEGQLRWREKIRYPHEYDSSEDYRKWLTYEGPYAYVDNRDKFIERLKQYEELTGESLESEKADLLQYLDLAAKQRTKWKDTQKKF